MNLKEALDTAPFVCTLQSATLAVYGPFSAETSMDFCDHYNQQNDSIGVVDRWIAIPLLVLNSERFPNV